MRRARPCAHARPPAPMPSHPDKALVGLLLGEELFVVAVDRLIDVVREPSVQSMGASGRVSGGGAAVAVELRELLGRFR
jgi:hypothetical protein